MTQPTSTSLSAFEADLKKQPLFLSLRALLQARRDTLAWRHEIGRTVAEFQKAVTDKKKGWFEMLAQIVGQSTSNLTKHREFAKKFALKEAQDLDKQGCLWGMITTVMHVQGKSERERLLDKALAKQWNLEELKVEIGKKGGLGHAGGRRARSPKTPEMGLRHLDKLSGQWLRYYNEVWVGGDKPLSAQVQGLSASHLGKALTETKKTIAELEKAVVGVRKVLGKLGRS